MPTYHFTAEPSVDLPPSRIAARFGKTSYQGFGTFTEAKYFSEGVPRIMVGNCEGSLITVDLQRLGVNKVHVGELTIPRPHAECSESHGKEGPRIDLSDFDRHYAKHWLIQLRRWRDPVHREELRQQYQTHEWYCIPHRLKQIGISPQGLEEQIQVLEKHLKSLEQNPQARYVSSKAKELEKTSSAMVALMHFEIFKLGEPDKKLTRTQAMKPKIIANSDIITLAERIKTDLTGVLDYIVPKVDMKQAKRYWEEVDAWENL